MEGLNIGNGIEKVEVVEKENKTIEAQGRILKMFEEYKTTPEAIKTHGVLTERF